MAAELKEIPAVVHDLTDAEAAEWALVENVQREDLNAVDRGEALRNLCERFGMSQGEIADRMGLDRSTVANMIRLTDLEPEIKEMIVAGKLTAGHGRALLALPKEERVKMAIAAEAWGWNVRRVEREARLWAERQLETAGSGGGGGATDPRKAAHEANLRDLERRLGAAFGTKVSLRTDRSGKKGDVTFEFYGLDHFAGLMAKFGV